MNIVFAADRGYTQHLAVAMASLLENNSGMNIYVIHNDIPADDWKKLKKIFMGKDSKLINAEIDDGQIENLITTYHFTKANYYRLFIPDIVKDNKALYLDTDIVVNRPIDDLYNTDVSNTSLAAVDNMGYYSCHDLEMNPSAKYFNSGVMLINLEYWRANSIKDKVIDFIKRKPEVIRFVDQDGLNSVINGYWLELHPKYNLHGLLLFSGHDADLPAKEFIDDPVIIHYTGTYKPWHYKSYHPYKHLYWKYLRKTPYKYFIPDDFKIMDALKGFVPAPIRKFIKRTLYIREN